MHDKRVRKHHIREEKGYLGQKTSRFEVWGAREVLGGEETRSAERDCGEVREMLRGPYL